jgi:hypothetical protein
MRLALFDLDNTLLGGDSDHAWGDYLCERGFLDPVAYKARNDEFYQDYLAGKLDNAAYLNFCLEILGRTEMARWSNGTTTTCATASSRSCCPRRLNCWAAPRRRRQAGDHHRHQPLRHRADCRTPGRETLIATECEMVDGRYTGRSTDAVLPRRQGDAPESLAGGDWAFAGRQLFL